MIRALVGTLRVRLAWACAACLQNMPSQLGSMCAHVCVLAGGLRIQMCQYSNWVQCYHMPRSQVFIG